MPAPKGNDYAKEFWPKKTVAKKGEKSVRVSIRLSESEIEAIKEKTKSGESVGTWIRERTREALTAS